MSVPLILYFTLQAIFFVLFCVVAVRVLRASYAVDNLKGARSGTLSKRSGLPSFTNVFSNALTSVRERGEPNLLAARSTLRHRLLALGAIVLALVAMTLFAP